MISSKRAQKLIVKAFKVIGWAILVMLFLLVLLMLLLRLPYVQRKLTQRAISYLEEKIGTTVSLNKIYIAFPKRIVLEGLYMEDQTMDTLLYVGRMGIDTDLWGLTRNRIQLNDVNLTNTVAKINRAEEDTTFNFNYIIEAFATENSSADTTTSKWIFSLEKIELSDTRADFHDRFGGTIMDLNLVNLSMDLDEFDLSKPKIGIANFAVDDTQLNVSIIPGNTETVSKDENTSESPTKTAFPFNIDFKTIEVSKVKVNYDNQITGQRLSGLLGELFVESKSINWDNKSIDLENITLKESFISYHQSKGKHVEESNRSEQQISLKTPWSLKLNALSFASNGFQYDNNNVAHVNNSIDFNHLWIFGVQAEARNLLFANEKAEMQLNSLSFREMKGFTLGALAFKTSLTEREFTLQNLKVNTNSSHIMANANASFESIADAINNYEHVNFNLAVKQSSIGLQDIKLFAPQIDSLPIQLSKNTIVYLDTQLSGRIGDLKIDRLNLRAFDSTSISLTGKIKGLPIMEQVNGELNIKEVYSIKADISKILPDSLQQLASRLPVWMSLHGDLRGNKDRQTGDIILNTSSGALNVRGTYSHLNGNAYDGELSVDKLDLGTILRQNQFGHLTMHAAVKGSGITMDTLNTLIDATVNEFLYNDYVYKDFKIKGSIVNYMFSGMASLEDENLNFVLKGDLNYAGDAPEYKLNFNLKNANFQNLNLSARPLKARAVIDADLKIEGTASVNGILNIRHVGIYNGDALYTVDSLLVASIDQDEESVLSIRSDILSGNFKGTFNLLKLPDVLKQQINQYFTLYDTAFTRPDKPQNFKFDLTIKNTDLLTEIIFPDLKPFVPGKIEGEFDSELNKLTIDMELTKIKYASAAVDSVVLNIDADKEALNYRFRLKNVTLDSLQIEALQLSGTLANDSLQIAFYILDAEEKTKYQLGGSVNHFNDAYRFHFNKDQVILDYNPWQVPIDNYLQFGRSVTTNNFSLANEGQKISIISSESDSSYVFRFDRFQLSNFTKMVSGVVPASGLLNGELRFTTERSGAFSSNLKIEEFFILEQNWGNAEIVLSHTNDLYVADLNIIGQNHNLKAAANYSTKGSTPEINANVKFDPLDLSKIEPLTFGQLKNLTGTAVGTMKLTGNLDRPLITGELLFNNASFLSTYLNNTFILQQEHIVFQNTGIAFNNFVIRDERKNEASINGEIKTEAYKKFDLNLKVNSKNFQILNTTAKDNSLYYGMLKINANVTIVGSSLAPKVDVSLSVSDDSNLTYIVPQSEKDALQEKGIVQFVDKDAKNDPFLADLPVKVSANSEFTGLDLTADVTLKDKSSLHIIIDPLTGDKLSMNGNAKLILNMNPSGTMNLSGRYEISKGTYNFSFHNLVKREFDIEKGSSIVWSGDPLNATMDIKAIYKVETSPLDLVYNQINTTNQSEINSYSQRLPFLVYLLIKGKLLEPDIGFKLDMPENERNAMGGAIYAKLQDINTRESDLNKQVFALLILKRFIADNPLENQARSGLSNAARLSVSRILSDQLNRLSQNIKGVELSVDVKSYQNYAGTEVVGDTKVQLGVSKSLFDERLVVKVSGNVDVEGSTSSSATDYIGDIALEYKLTSDGRFRITGFRNSNFDMIDGELTETGAGLIYIKDYNTLRELFKSNAKED